MSNIERKKKQIEIDVVELKVEFDADFFDDMAKAKADVAQQRGYDVSYGEYIQEALEDLVTMVESYGAKLQDAAEIIKKQDNALGNPSPEEFKKIEEGPVDPKTGEVEEDVPEELYAHIIKDEDKRTMYQ